MKTEGPKWAPVFLPPELSAQEEFRELEGAAGGTDQTDRLRRLYFKRLYDSRTDELSDRELVQLVLEHAKRVIAHPTRPTVRRLEAFTQYPFGELALEEMLEDSPLLASSRFGPEELAAEELLVERQMEKSFSCLLMLDCSSSMSGEKHLLACIAVAVLLLEVPPRDASLVVFSSRAQTIKAMLSEQSAEQTVLRFLQTRPKGFTNIYAGLAEGMGQLKRMGGSRRRIGLMATDGRSTEGGDPLELARQFDCLVVLHLHGPGSHLEASREMAQKGNGVCLEVESFEQLPHRLYDALRMLARL